ncbi:MAG: hypothetical protein P1V51_19695 [Deltaproteobacteria bacterium]|nr:hypothetical protein [Deltaproteobacteria bacterium]
MHAKQFAFEHRAVPVRQFKPDQVEAGWEVFHSDQQFFYIRPIEEGRDEPPHTRFHPEQVQSPFAPTFDNPVKS